MKPDSVHITQIIHETTLKEKDSHYTVCWIKNEVKWIEINHVRYKNVSNSIYFLASLIPKHSGKSKRKMVQHLAVTLYTWTIRS